MDATTFLEEVYRLHGGLVERQADRLVALAPPASGLPESAEVWAGTPAQRLSSVDHYVRMLSLRGGRTFTEGRYAIDRITDERRQEMIAALERDRIGFMAP